MPPKEPTKSFQVRIKRENWLFLKKISAEQERSMANIVENCIEKYRKRFENKLTDNDTVVS